MPKLKQRQRGKEWCRDARSRERHYYDRKPGYVAQEIAALKRPLTDWAFMKRYCAHRANHSGEMCQGVARTNWLKGWKAA